MNSKVFITDNELAKYGKTETLSQKVESLLVHQKKNWDLVNKNFNALNNVKIKKYDFNKFYVSTQFNPSRIKSSAAKVDTKSIENRACFLCEKNLPNVQKGINYNNKYIILCNPYPIFKQHLTIPHHEHIPQNIKNSLPDLLSLSYDLRDNFFVFYNGPKCGASAPDHLHFQAGLKNTTPLEKYYGLLAGKEVSLKTISQTKVKIVNELFFNFILIQSNNLNEINKVFRNILYNLKNFQNISEEPLLNIISSYKNDRWNLIIIPREKHRPAQFFLEGDSKIMISPASIDMAGLLITPRKEDFEELTNPEIKDIYSQVVFGDDLLVAFKKYF